MALKLSSLSRVKLAHWPTPVDELLRVRHELGCSAHIFIKRDDLASLAFGGSKLRNLEILSAEAQAAGANVLIASGGVQSNCTRTTAAIAAKLGMECVVVVNGKEPQQPTGNLLLCRLLGARIEFVATREERKDATGRIVEDLRVGGKTPFEIPVSAATPAAGLALAQAVFELVEQMPPPDVILVCSSSGATQAGLLLGCALRGLGTRVIGISPDDPAAEIRGRIHEFISGMTRLLNVDQHALPDFTIEIDDTYVSGASRTRTAECDQAVTFFARTEGLLLDPVYTSRPAAALLAGLKAGQFAGATSVLLWHTGGQAMLFA